MPKFTIQFFPHVQPQRVSELAGMLGSLGIMKFSPPSTVEIDVTREGRTDRVRRTLNNWQISGWVDEFREN